jgi:hypothetical protein
MSSADIQGMSSVSRNPMIHRVSRSDERPYLRRTERRSSLRACDRCECVDMNGEGGKRLTKGDFA